MKQTGLLSAIVMCFLVQETHAEYISLDGEMAFASYIEQEHADYLADRRLAIPGIICPFQAPPKARLVLEDPTPWEDTTHRWRRGITATVFWVGEETSERNPTSNEMSAWDTNWEINYGGVDQPSNRSGFQPAAFAPRMNPFYIALPYDDLAPESSPEAQASKIVPWYWKSYKGGWSSTCKGKWLTIHYRGKVCYAQWEDVGPFHNDDWQYVFKGNAPKPNPNGNAGIEVSPAVRDFLGIRSGYRVAWKFIEQAEIPDGPWNQWQ